MKNARDENYSLNQISGSIPSMLIDVLIDKTPVISSYFFLGAGGALGFHSSSIGTIEDGSAHDQNISRKKSE